MINFSELFSWLGLGLTFVVSESALAPCIPESWVEATGPRVFFMAKLENI